MKIFMSHSSRQKLFVKALTQHLPASMALWIDERELRVGTNIEEGLESAVRQASDLFVLVVDRDANRSEWVGKEIGWAIQKEKELGQTFLLPIVVEPEAWAEADPRIRDRKFLTVQDFTDESIAAVGRALTSEIFEWLSNRLASERSVSPGELERRSNAELLRNADQLTAGIGSAIKAELLPFRVNNPITLHDLLVRLRDKRSVDVESEEELYNVLERLSSQHLLNGVEFDDETAYLLRENYSYKADLYVALKKQIARHAARRVRTGMTIAIDGGSTVQPVVETVRRRLRTGSVQGLNIITNFIPAAAALLEELSELGADDRDRLARVFMIGGYTRAVSLTTIPVDFATGSALTADPTIEYDRILEATGPIDIAFLGANGCFKRSGLGTHNPYETSVKSWFVKNAASRIVLMDPSKLTIPQEIPFAMFTDRLEIMTAHSDDDLDAIAQFEAILEGTGSTLEVVG
jgi:DeoR/GlpR family transcriptional regulator of sugar metabolism